MSSPEKPPAEKTTTPPPTNSKKPFSSPNEMVTFIVGTGDKQETFQIHKQIACEHSEVWNRAFNSVFVEGQTQTYRIEDTGPEAFRLLTQWVYREKFDHIHSGDLDYPAKSLDFGRKVSNLSTPKLYYANSLYVYENTVEGSALRRFLVEQSCWATQPSHYGLIVYPMGMLRDIVTVLKAQLPANVKARKFSQMTGDNYLVEENPTTES
ncbi:uncharacterized protein EAF02_000682 [Botrytis sinoallii]|uniref:uncharacterized protein n=1 Tax=Botrytis sinoallii TaxID=1463999 RepID=UPI001901F3A4|nr:uncharacterized protein EAF02_000682 [Botrytis sinoallii]KAF7893144.1 hypothetical protein EAF02_000682 [Botrytis sinoallii]